MRHKTNMLRGKLENMQLVNKRETEILPAAHFLFLKAAKREIRTNKRMKREVQKMSAALNNLLAPV